MTLCFIVTITAIIRWTNEYKCTDINTSNGTLTLKLIDGKIKEFKWADLVSFDCILGEY